MLCSSFRRIVTKHQSLLLRKSLEIRRGVLKNTDKGRPRFFEPVTRRLPCGTNSPRHSDRSRRCGAALLTDDFHEHPLAAAAIELAIENLLPRPKVQFALGNGHDDLTPHDL